MKKETLYILKGVVEILSVIAICIGLICVSANVSFARNPEPRISRPFNVAGIEQLHCSETSDMNVKYYTQIFSRLPLPERQAEIYLPWGALCYVLLDEIYPESHIGVPVIRYEPPLSVWF